MKFFSLKSSTISILFLIFFSLNVCSQSKADSPLLLQTWSFKKLGFLSSNFIKSKKLDKNNLSFELQKDGKVIANWIEDGCYTGEINLKFKFKKIEGSWKKISDSVISFNLPTNISLGGSHVISNLTENELSLKKFVKVNKK